MSGRISPRASTQEPDMELDLPPSPPPVEDILAARRAKRQAILAKYTGVASVSTTVTSGSEPTSTATPQDFTLAREGNVDGTSGVELGGEQVSAVDYDPSFDRREDQQKRFGVDRNVKTVTDDDEVEEEEEDDVDDMFAISTTKKRSRKAKVCL